MRSVLNERERRHLRGAASRHEPIRWKNSPRNSACHAERVRQIECAAFEKVQKAVRQPVAATGIGRRTQPELACIKGGALRPQGAL